MPINQFGDSDDTGEDFKPFENGHRAQFTANLSWKNDFVHFYGNAAAVVGNQIDEKPVIVPFTIGFESLFPVYFANRRVAISALMKY